MMCTPVPPSIVMESLCACKPMPLVVVVRFMPPARVFTSKPSVIDSFTNESPVHPPTHSVTMFSKFTSAVSASRVAVASSAPSWLSPVSVIRKLVSSILS